MDKGYPQEEKLGVNSTDRPRRIKRLVEADENLRDKAFILTHYDGGLNNSMVQIDLRYMAETRKKAKTHSELSSIILDYLHENKLTVASSSLNVKVERKAD